MLDYLQQFNILNKEIRKKISSPQVMENLAQIEERYDLDLAMLVMRVVIKEIKLAELASFIADYFSLSKKLAEHLSTELENKVFFVIKDYLQQVETIAPIQGKHGRELEDIAKNKEVDQDINKDPNKDKVDFLAISDSDFKIGVAFIPTVDIVEIINKAELNFLDEFLVERLKNILNIYLKGVRDRINTKETLIKNINIGGLSLSAIEADRILKLCDRQVVSSQKIILVDKLKSAHHLGAITKNKQTTLQADTAVAGKLDQEIKPNLAADPILVLDYDLKKALASGETKKISSAEKLSLSRRGAAISLKQDKLKQDKITSVKAKEQTSTSIPGPTLVSAPTLTQISKPKKDVLDRFKKTSASSPTMPPKLQTNRVKQAPATSVARRKEVTLSGRVQVKDVKVAPKIMGPIEELLYLDVTNFRRLGSNPQESTRKIFNKIKLLEKGGYDRMIAGIKAWKRSPVSLLYLKTLKEAMNSNLSVAQVIAIYQNQNQVYLTKEELDAIIELNSRLVV